MSIKEYKNKYNLKFNCKQGLTLIELLVVVSIFTIVTGITIFNYGNFNSSITTQNLADDIALTIRKAQGYAVGVHGFENPSINGYGVHFTTDKSLEDVYGSNEAFILFADMKDGSYPDLSNKLYDNITGDCNGTPNPNAECLEVLNILGGDEISEIYISENNSSGNFESDVPGSSIDIVFKRPNPEPTFCYREYLSSSCEKNIRAVKIKISSENNPDNLVSRYVTISNTGQISVSLQ